MIDNSKITNQKLLKVLSNNDYMLVGSRKGTKLVFNEYHGCCTSGPEGWYKQAGITLHWWNGIQPVTYNNSHSRLEGCGMIQVWHGTFNDLNNLTSDNLRPGDVATLYTGRCGHQHAEMWTGHDWRSDAIQRRGSCYSSSNQGEWSAVIWRHPDLQQKEWGDINNMHTKIGGVDFSGAQSFSSSYDYSDSLAGSNYGSGLSSNLNRGANNVSRLYTAPSSSNESSNSNNSRLDAFGNMINNYAENAPQMGREIVVVTELNGSEILTNGQNAKSKNSAT